MTTIPAPAATGLVVEEADGAVLVCGNGDGLRRVTDHAVDQLAACEAKQILIFNPMWLINLIGQLLGPQRTILGLCL